MMGEYIRRWAAEGAHAGEIQGPFSLEGITAWECDLSGCAPLEPASVQPAHVEALFCRAGQLRATLCKGQTVCAGPGELLLVSDAAELRRFSLEDGCFQGIFALMDKAASKGVIHKNQAANRKIGIMALANTVATDADRAAYVKPAKKEQKTGSKKAERKAARLAEMKAASEEKAKRREKQLKEEAAAQKRKAKEAEEAAKAEAAEGAEEAAAE